MNNNIINAVYISTLLYALKLCHNCVLNSESSDEIISIMNRAADHIKLEPQDRWWANDAN